MYSFEIERVIREHGGVLPEGVYRRICESPQVKVTKTPDGMREIRTADGFRWTVKKEG